MVTEKRKAIILGRLYGTYGGVLTQLKEQGFEEVNESGMSILHGEIDGKKVDVYLAFGGEKSQITDAKRKELGADKEGVPYAVDVIEHLNKEYDNGKIDSVTMLGITGVITSEYEPGDIIIPEKTQEIIIEEGKVGISKVSQVDNNLSDIKGYEGRIKKGARTLTTPAHFGDYVNDPQGFVKQLDEQGIGNVDMETAVVLRRCKAPAGAALVVSDRIYSENFKDVIGGRLEALNKSVYGLIKKVVNMEYKG